MIKVEMEAAELAKLNQAFKDLAKVSDKPIGDLLKQEGRLMAVELAKQTDIKGLAVSVGKKHEQKIATRIKGIYSDPMIWVKIVSKRAGVPAGTRFKRMVKRDNNIAGAEKMLRELGLGTYKGKRVTVIMWDHGKKHREVLKTRKRKSEYSIVCDYKQVKPYIIKQQHRAGNLKSGWARAAEMLGGAKEIKAWAKAAKRNHDNKGIGKVSGTKNKKILFLANLYQDSGKLSDRVYGAGAIKNRVAKINKRIEFEVKRELKRLKRKYK